MTAPNLLAGIHDLYAACVLLDSDGDATTIAYLTGEIEIKEEG